MNVILNEVKNLLSSNTLSTLSLVGFEEMLEFLYLAPPRQNKFTCYALGLIATFALLSMTEYCE